MKKFIYLIVLALILSLVLTGCFLSNISQVPATEQNGVAYLTKNPSPSDLVGLWHFDSDATDSSGNGNHGILQGDAGFDTGMFGQALSVDGAGDYIDVGDIGVTGDWTVEFWANLGSASATIYYPIGLSLGSPNGKGIFVGGTYAPTAGKWGVYDGTNWILGSDVYTDTWYHFAVTKSGTTYTIYRGAAYENSGALTDIDISDLDIGRRSEGVWYFDGLIDEVRIWSSALTATQLNDITPPAITITTPVEDATYLLNEVVNASWTVTDGGTGVDPATVTATAASGSPINTGTVGPHAFTVTATDYAKNTDIKTVNYTVIYNWTGFFPPVDNVESNVVKAGRAIPVKFSLNGDQGLNIFESGYPKPITIACDGTSNGLEVEPMTAGESSLKYDAEADQYIYVWKTDKGWAGFCRQLVVKLIDGTSHVANFSFK